MHLCKHRLRRKRDWKWKQKFGIIRVSGDVAENDVVNTCLFKSDLPMESGIVQGVISLVLDNKRLVQSTKTVA